MYIALPVGIAYADWAGVPPVVGRYSAIFPLFAYALFGSSRQLMTGPDAATCLNNADDPGADEHEWRGPVELPRKEYQNVTPTPAKDELPARPDDTFDLCGCRVGVLRLNSYQYYALI